MRLPELIPGTLIKRYKRFLADIRLESGEIITAFTPNTGTMKTCSEPGSAVLLSKSDNPKRKYALTWELVYTNNVWVGINTHAANLLVKEAIQAGKISELTGYTSIQTEVKYGKNSRIDLLLSNDSERCYIEVKNVTLGIAGVAYFPDAVTARGAKHLRELMEMKKQGHRAVMFYVVQRPDTELFKPAAHIDSTYSTLLQEAHDNGIEILAYTTRFANQLLNIDSPLPYSLDSTVSLNGHCV